MIKLLICFLILCAIIWGIGWVFGHRWKYHNPYDRTCTKCGKYQVKYCWSMETRNKDWWETHSDGDGSCN